MAYAKFPQIPRDPISEKFWKDDFIAVESTDGRWTLISSAATPRFPGAAKPHDHMSVDVQLAPFFSPKSDKPESDKKVTAKVSSGWCRQVSAITCSTEELRSSLKQNLGFTLGSLSLDRSQFERVFSTAHRAITQSSSGLAKIVVAVKTNKFLFTRDHFASAFNNMISAKSAGSLGYAYRWKGAFGLGASPEVLFSCRSVLGADGPIEGETHALAGTLPWAEASALLASEKNSHEHDLVTREIVQSLRDFGADASVGPRRLKRFQNLAHIETPISFRIPQLLGKNIYQSLLDRLHPTPALGVSPKSPANLDLLRQLRADLPSAYGAPLTVVELASKLAPETARSVVQIRGIFGANDSACIPVGCGLLAASVLEDEWVEVNRKLSSIVSLFT